MKKVVYGVAWIFGCFFAQATGMSGQDKRKITFEGQEKYLLEHILQSKVQPTCKFSVTSVVKKVKEGHFEVQGDVLSLTENDIKKDIMSNNWVYIPSYTLAQTRLSNGGFEEIGAIILGTDDVDEANWFIASRRRKYSK